MASRLIAIHSPTNGAGKSTLAKVLHYLAWKKQVEKNELSIIPNLTYDEFINLGGPDKVSPYRTRSFADLPNDVYELIKGERFKDLPREKKELRRDQFVDMCETLKHKVFHESIWTHALMLQWKEDSAWIIDDLRFEDELDAIVARDGLVIEIIDDSRETKDYDLDTSVSNNDLYIIKKQPTVKELVEVVSNLNIF